MIPEAKKPLVLEGISFATGSATLTPGSYAVLGRVADSLKDHPDVKIEVGGYTDSTGSPATNQKLSQKRAEAVRDYLIGQGIDAARLTAKGYGPTQPIADNTTSDGRARNRRVELARIG
jgi:OOP family OmpA-OmpF porin